MTDVKFTGTSDFERVKKDYEQLAKHTAKVEAENQKLKKTTEQAGRASKDAYGAGAVSRLGAMVAGVVSISTATRLASSAMSFFAAEAQRGVASVNKLADASIRLNQIALNAKDLGGLQVKADELAARYGADRGQTAGVLFSARSEGFEHMAERIVSLNQVLDPIAASTVVGKLPGLFPKHPVTGEEALAMTFEAARQSNLTFEQMAEAMPKLSEGAGLTQTTPAEALAVESVMASRFSSGRSAADRGKAYATKIGITPGLNNLSMLEAHERIVAAPEEVRAKWLGESQELNAFYNILEEEKALIRERMAAIDAARSNAGTSSSSLEQARIRGETNERLRAQRQLTQQRVRQEIMDERRAMQRIGGAQGVIDAMERNQGLTLGRWGGSTAAEGANYLGLPGPMVERIGVDVGHATEMALGAVLPTEMLGATEDRRASRARMQGAAAMDVLMGGFLNRFTAAIAQQTAELVEAYRSSDGPRNNSSPRAAQQERVSQAVE